MACPKCGYCEHCGRSNPSYLPYYPDSTTVPYLPNTYIGPLPPGTTYTFNGKSITPDEAKELADKVREASTQGQ